MSSSKFAKYIFTFILCLGFQASLVGCVSKSYQLMMDTAKQLDEQTVVSNVATQLDLLETRVAKAQASGISIFANDDMQEAMDALSQARNFYSRFQKDASGANASTAMLFGQPTGEKALALIARANVALSRAEKNKHDSDIILNEFTRNLEWLQKFNAPYYFPAEYREIERAHNLLSDRIAKGKTHRALEQLPEFLQEQKALEISSAQRYYLKDLHRRIEDAGTGDINRYAEQSYSKCTAAFTRAKLTIAQNPRSEKEILTAIAEVKDSIKMAYSVAREMQNLVDMDQRQLEGWLLLLTTQLNQTGQAFGAEDLRNLSVLKQAEMLTQLALQPRVAILKGSDKINAVATAESPDAETPEPTEQLSTVEQSLIKKMQALDAELQAMKVKNQTASAPVSFDLDLDFKPKTKRRSLFIR
ncbi:MAG: hypothetical protein JKY67_09325 [Pseudomonadales bacterium]|nr:hypothetical protein [Pseudomonadales bacterium]